ncbi:MAG: hypothetical protein HC812_04295 [Leptolyngbya sp. RL_3_1]|nr:hypothetical protein [Leptolyngbya sp. RL_3_1]
MSHRDNSRIRRFFVDKFIASYERPPVEVVLDIDVLRSDS